MKAHWSIAVELSLPCGWLSSHSRSQLAYAPSGGPPGVRQHSVACIFAHRKSEDVRLRYASRFGPELPTRCSVPNTTVGFLWSRKPGLPWAASGRCLGRPTGLGTPTASIASVKKANSWRCPAVRRAAIGSPLPSLTRVYQRWRILPGRIRGQNLLPRLLGWTCPLFIVGRPTGCRAAGPDRCAVHIELVPVDMALSVEFSLKLLDNRLQSAIFSPSTKSVVDSFPRPITLGKIPPRGSRTKNPEDPIYHFPVVLVGPASSVDFRKSIFNAIKLLIGQFVAATSGHRQISEQVHLRLDLHTSFLSDSA